MIMPNEDKFDSITISKEIIKFLESHKVKVLSEKSKAALLNIEAISEKNIQNIEYFISLGGDGTILKNIHEYSYLNKPFLGINLGSLGFMTDIPLNDIYISLQDLLNKNFTIENRIMLEVKSNSKLIAANDIVFHRRENPSLIDLSVYLNGKYLNTFSADGLIIATPNGSTAYSLSSGGPILMPELDAFVLTAISPHTISIRPIVIRSDVEIEIKYISNNNNNISYFVDGMHQFSIKAKESVTLVKSKTILKLIKLKNHDYFSTLRTKLNWSGNLKI